MSQFTGNSSLLSAQGGAQAQSATTGEQVYSANYVNTNGQLAFTCAKTAFVMTDLLY